ncbi:MAG: hypothetical protein ACRCXA_10085 [Peptostreptococcaceae bacterium]
MVLKKMAKKSIALALISVAIATPILNSVSAMEKSDSELITSKQVVDNSTRAINDFTAMYGEDDIYKLVKEEGNIKYEVNGKQGIIRATILNDEGAIEDQITINYLKNLNNYKSNPDEVATNDKETRYSRTFETVGPDSLKLTVKSQTGTTRYKLTAHGAQGRDKTKTYTKEGSNWNSGNTKVMNDFTRYADKEFREMRRQLGGAWISQVASVLADLVKDSKYSVKVAILKNLLEIAGVTGSGLAALGECVNYLYNVGKADGAYHKL